MKRYKAKRIALFALIIVLSICGGCIIQYRQTQYRSFFVQKVSMGQESAEQEKSDESEKPILVNINTDSAEELERLEGIGEKTAQRIINYRKRNGDFEVVEDIMRVSGIGKKKFESIKDFICVY